MKLDLHYVDPRLVALYDRDNPRGIDTDFYLALAEELGARRIVDLGCGTGTLTCELAGEGRELVGIDPSPAMLAIARGKPKAELVRWIEGDSSSLGSWEADLALMSGNVAQVFLEDSEWDETLRALHAALRPGGTLAFESRNPLARAWEEWNREASFERIDSPFGPMECWVELDGVEEGRVRFRGLNRFLATGETVAVPSELRFRDRAELTVSLEKAGFEIEGLFGGWAREPFVEGSRLMVVVARRT